MMCTTLAGVIEPSPALAATEASTPATYCIEIHNWPSTAPRSYTATMLRWIRPDARSASR